MSESDERNVVVVQPQSQAFGICALIFAIISIFFMAFIFVPLAIIFAIVALVKGQVVMGICAIIIAIVSGAMSPTIWALFM